MNQEKQASRSVESNSSGVNQHEKWFENLIGSVKQAILQDKQSLEAGSASKETMAFYTSLRDGNMIQAMTVSREAASKALISEIALEYVKQLYEKKTSIKKLAMDNSSNKILVWAEINDDDEEAELGLIRIESKINGKYMKTGISLNSTIVESSDCLKVPSHYIIIQD